MNDQQLTVQQEPSVALMLQSALSQGVTKDNAEAIGKLMEVYERMEGRRAEQQFAAAMVELQSQMPTIVASSVIPNRGKYERFEDIMAQIAPLLKKHGFTATFSMDIREGGRIAETCTLQHVGGHSKSNTFIVRARKADNDTQADCMAATTAKRNALCNALNLVIRQDCLSEENDPTMESDKTVTKEQAETLRRMVKEARADEAKFLAWLGAAQFEAIAASRYEDAFAQLERKREKQSDRPLDRRNASGEFEWEVK